VFHVSKLKKVGVDKVIAAQLPESSVAYQVPEVVLDTRMVKREDTEVTQVLIKWSKMRKDLATWEDKEGLHQ
jgi:hypothetical protein